MTTQTTGLFTGVDQIGIFYQTWSPDHADATVVLVHGYAEHSGRYAHVAQALNERGYAVWALDHRGHGRSEGERAFVKQFDHFVADLTTFVDLVRAQRPDGPLFMLGHSMGGLIATLYALRHQQQLTGLVLSGPAFKTDEGASPLLLAVSGVVSKIAPHAPASKLDSAAISRDQAVVDRYLHDPLVYTGPVKARMAREIILAGQQALAQAPRLHIPVLVVQGDADRLVSPTGTQAVFDAFGSSDKQIVRYPNLYHEVMNEPEQAEVLALIGDWLDQHRD